MVFKDNVTQETHAYNMVNISDEGEECTETSVNVEITDTSTDSLEEISLRLLSSLYLRLESKSFLCKRTLQNVISAISDIDTLNTEYITKKLHSSGFQVQKEMLTKNLFYNAHNTENGILRTNFLREKYYKSNLNYIAPKRIDLERNKDVRAQWFYYVPLLETLNVLLKHKDVSNECFRPTILKENIFSDITDGDVYKKMHSFKKIHVHLSL